MNKAKLAREWLLFLCCLVIGLFIIPFIIWIIYSSKNYNIFVFYNLFFKSLLIKDHETIIARIIVVSPYVTIQFIRSIIWSIRTLKHG